MYQFNYQVGKKTLQFVAGLRWQPLVPDSFRKNLLPLSVELRADLYVYRKSGKSMVGFGATESGARVGQIALALMVANALEKESSPSKALIAIKLPNSDNQVCYLMIQDGYVVAGYDRVQPEEEAREAYFADLSTDDDWDVLICPAEWEVAGSEQRDIDSFIPKRGASVRVPDSWRLRPVKPSRIKSVLMMAILAAAAFGVVKGYQWWIQSKQERVAMQIAAEQAQAAEMARQQKISTLPWLSMPTATDFALACEQALDVQSVAVPGWNFAGFRCEGNSFTMNWTRDPKAGLISAMKSRYPQASFSPDSGQATIIGPLQFEPSATKGGSQAEVPSVSERVDQLRDAPLLYGYTLTIAADSRTPRMVDGVVLPWTDFRFTVESSISPRSIVPTIDAPGMRIQNITGSISSGLFKYQLQGIQYAKP